MSRPNEQIILRWTGRARFNPAEAQWAVEAARSFASAHAPDRAKHTGLRRSVVYGLQSSEGGIYEDRAAYIYFTRGGAVVVRIHTDEQEQP